MRCFVLLLVTCSWLPAHAFRTVHVDSLAPHPHFWLDHWSVAVGTHWPRANADDFVQGTDFGRERVPRLNFAVEWLTPLERSELHIGGEFEHSQWLIGNPRLPLNALKRENMVSLRTYADLLWDPFHAKWRPYIRGGAFLQWDQSKDVQTQGLGVGLQLGLGVAADIGKRTRRLEFWVRTPQTVGFSQGDEVREVTIRSVGVRTFF